MIGLMEGMVRDCVDSLHERMGEAELWEVRLLVEMAVAAMSASMKQWTETTDQTLTDENRRTWAFLLDRSLTRLETGFARSEH
ncbi:hypothetical protein [Kocuria palustris]|uniref:hypothetical protein n=1 Tax=Kocuria palustris TaxID=71999 RepID=UPI0021A5B6AA|nr:hypothetical protein [Kocuria palustris]MCT1590023.1 hypothetical protein [Kocuria palustris]